MEPVPQRYGEAVEIVQGVRRLIVANPSPMTYWGTNTYLVGTGSVAVVDPGPDDPAHLQAILAASGGDERIEAIYVTHSHRDHSPLAAQLGRISGAPVVARGDAFAGRSDRMAALADLGGIGGGEGTDHGFAPDERLDDGEDHITGAGRLKAVATPGHFANHLCFEMPGTGILLTGDHVMGWASTLVSPPDGDLTDFMASLEKLAARTGDTLFLPGHGPAIEAPLERVAELHAHRRMREDQIRAALAEAPGNAADLATRIYTDTPAALLPAAARNVLAHLIDLQARGLASPGEGALGTAEFALSDAG